jgi:hypothetical protein
MRKEQTSGPFSAKQLKQMAAAGMILAADLISTDQVNWKPAVQVKGLFQEEQPAEDRGATAGRLRPPALPDTHAVPRVTRGRPAKRAAHASQPYSRYDQVPFYQKQGFFWLMYFLFTPVALAILLFGDVYYEKNGKVKSFGLANKIIAAVIAIVILVRIFIAFTK